MEEVNGLGGGRDVGRLEFPKNNLGSRIAGRRKKQRKTSFYFFGDRGPLVGNSNNKHFTKGDQLLYFGGVLAVCKGRSRILVET